MLQLNTLLNHLSRADRLEAVYFIGRVLSERISKVTIETQLQNYKTIEDRVAVVRAIKRVVETIETNSGTLLQLISDRDRKTYLNELNEAAKGLREGVKSNITDAEISQELDRLRLTA